MKFEIFDVEIPMPLGFEFIQPGEFGDPYYNVRMWEVDDHEYVAVGMIRYYGGQWCFSQYDIDGWPIDAYTVDASDLREIADKLDQLNKGVRK